MTPPAQDCAAGCSVFPASRSSAWGNSGRIARSELAAPVGLPGRFTIKHLPARPLTPRPRAANRVSWAPCWRMSSARPGTRRSHTARVASGVLSRADRPVPPVVNTNCAFRLASRKRSIRGKRSSEDSTTLKTSHPDSERIRATAGPERSSCSPAEQRSLAVRTMADRPWSDRTDILAQHI